MLNGGHYISYAANPNNAWYCYNDSSCREIPAQPNIDPGSAYLLFYERKGLDYAPYLPNVNEQSLRLGAAGAAGENGNAGSNGPGGGGVHSNGGGGIAGIGGGPHGLGGLGAADLDDVDPELRKTCTIS